MESGLRKNIRGSIPIKHWPVMWSVLWWMTAPDTDWKLITMMNCVALTEENTVI